jgi:hypothetical protein
MLPTNTFFYVYILHTKTFTEKKTLWRKSLFFQNLEVENLATLPQSGTKNLATGQMLTIASTKKHMLAA